MNLSLKTKVTVFTAAVVIVVSAISTVLSISTNKKSIEREVIARGIALSETLARSVDEGLAAENLNLIKHVEDIVHTKDVLMTQVFSTIWLGVASVPSERLNTPPDPGVADYFRSHPGEHDYYFIKKDDWFEIYHTIMLDPHDARVPKVLIGFVRLRVSTDAISAAVRRAILNNILAGALFTLIAVTVLNAIIGKYILTPILDLHRSVARHRQGEFPETVPVNTNDEIGELSAEFNEMSRALREREKKLAEEKERLVVTLRSIGDAVIVTDLAGTITLFNKVAERHTGWPAQEAVGKPLDEVFHIINERTRDRCENLVERVVKNGTACGLANHTALVKRDGSEIIIEDSAAPIHDQDSEIIGVVLVFRDVTEKQRIEEELSKSEKLQSVGLLAGGLAHDFNNLLTSIVGNISLAKMYVDGRSKAYQRLTEAEAASRRATDLTYQLLTFSKGGAPIRQTTSIVDCIRESASFALSGTNVSLTYRAGRDIWPVEVDAGQMNQAFNNLIINAVQAMSDGGSITITVDNVAITENEVPILEDGAYIKISVQDSGAGISEEHLPKIFDPYFTTKQNGSGLGLASTYSIIKKHEGHITVESKVGLGTTFHIYLPASPGKPVAWSDDEGALTRGQGRVLLMDDEAIIREVSGEMLKMLGYEVAFARHGDEAVELYQKAQDVGKPFDAVIMDITIPGGMGGKDAIQKLRVIDPKVKAIVSSGYSNDPIMADYKKYGFSGVITKPYSIECFSNALREAIQG